MGIASIIGTSVISGVVIYIIGFIIWSFGGKKYFWRFWYRKQLFLAREFLKRLDLKYNPETKEQEEREKRERHIANSGFNKDIIEYAQKLNREGKDNVRRKTRRKKRGIFKRRPKGNTGTSEGTNTGTEEGTDTGRSGNGSIETELKRLLPPSTPATPSRTEQTSEWDWGSFSKVRRSS